VRAVELITVGVERVAGAEDEKGTMDALGVVRVAALRGGDLLLGELDTVKRPLEYVRKRCSEKLASARRGS